MGFSDIALVLVVVGIAAAGAIELRPAVLTVFLAVNIRLCEILFHICIECSVMEIAHFIILIADKLMARVDIALGSYCNIFISAAAAPQTLYCAGSLIQVYHKMEEIIIIALFA